VALLGMVLLGACGWTQPRFDAGDTGSNPAEFGIGIGNVTGLGASWSIPKSVGFFDPVLVGGSRVVTSLGSGVGVFDEQTGGLRWSVAPLHDVTTATVFVHPIALVADPDTPGRMLLIVGELDGNLPLHPQSASGSVTAYDLVTGATVWTDTLGGAPGLYQEREAVVYGATLYVMIVREFGDSSDFSGTAALDVATGAERFRVPGVIAKASDGVSVFGLNTETQEIGAFAATGCGGAVCAPDWTASTGVIFGDGAVTVANGRLYLSNGGYGLAVFDAAGCGSATCTPLWTAPGGYGVLAVTKTRVFAAGDIADVGSPAPLSVFDATGCGSSVCAALWTSHESRTYSAPVVANGLVYATAQAGPTDVWPAEGCGAAACDAVASLATNLNAPLTTLVADGRLFVAGESLLTYTPS
jgi:hypothetical protein